MLQSRRDFVKVLGASVASILLCGATSAGEALAASSTSQSVNGEKAMLYDASKCVGCRACYNACKRWNKLPPESIGYGGIYDNPSDLSAKTWTLIKAKNLEAGGNTELLLCKYQCMHCTEASCVSVCPTGSMHHEGEFVINDQEWCIGCNYCGQACPFGAVHRAEPQGTARKCTFCIDRQAKGLQPACVEVCPAGALQFGGRADLVAAGKSRVDYLKVNGYPNATLFGEYQLGGLHALYILLDRPSSYSLPDTPHLATSRVLAQWLSGIVTAGVVVAVPFWLLFRRKELNDPDRASGKSGKER